MPQNARASSNDYSGGVNEKRAAVLKMALAAAERGLAVVPVKGKAPLTQHGYKDASSDRARVHAMFNAAPQATGYGIATGRASGIVVVDIDGPEGQAEAERLGLRSGYVVRTGRGWHLYYAIPADEALRSRVLAPGLELKAEGGYVVGPGSAHPAGGTYCVVKASEEPPTPAWVIAAGAEAQEPSGEGARPADANVAPLTVDVGGPPIVEGERNQTLARIAGRLHDGTRGLGQLTADLLAVNEARCAPPLEEHEVRKVAESIYGRKPCNPAPEATPWVKAAVDYLASVEHPVQGMGGATGWSIYEGLLDRARRYGWEHPQGVALSVDMRTAAQMVGTNASTVSRWLKRTPLASVIRRGSGRRATTVVLHLPTDKGHWLQHSSTAGGVKGNEPRSVATSALHRTLYRLRWSGGSAKARHGVVKGTSKVRQGLTPAREGVRRIGKSKAAVLHAALEAGGPVTRGQLAKRLGRKAGSLRAPLRWLVEAGLLVRPRRGVYALPADFSERLDDARELAGEPEADRMQIAEHARERAGYRNRHKRAASEPTPEGLAAVERSHRKREAEMRELAGTTDELQRLPDHAPPALVAALREYLRRNPHRRDEPPRWFSVALWAEDYLAGKPPPEAVELALYELREEAA